MSMVQYMIMWVSIALCFIGPSFITYFANRRLLKNQKLWLRLIALPVVFTMSFIVITLAMLASGAIPFER